MISNILEGFVMSPSRQNMSKSEREARLNALSWSLALYCALLWGLFAAYGTHEHAVVTLSIGRNGKPAAVRFQGGPRGARSGGVVRKTRAGVVKTATKAEKAKTVPTQQNGLDQAKQEQEKLRQEAQKRAALQAQREREAAEAAHREEMARREKERREAERQREERNKMRAEMDRLVADYKELVRVREQAEKKPPKVSKHQVTKSEKAKHEEKKIIPPPILKQEITQQEQQKELVAKPGPVSTEQSDVTDVAAVEDGVDDGYGDDYGDEGEILVGQQSYEEGVSRDQVALTNSINRTWRPPRGLDVSLTARCRVILRQNGAVEDVQIEQKSGVLAFDMSARATLWRLQYPETYWGKALVIIFGGTEPKTNKQGGKP